jgi:tetratricopeptide (TPR) repeat protein
MDRPSWNSLGGQSAGIAIVAAGVVFKFQNYKGDGVVVISSWHTWFFMDRIAALNEVLTEHPKDAFARYGLAMEYSKQGDFDRALAEFAILLENHPDYTAGYFMAAQTLVRAERVEEAKKMLQDGIGSARRTGNLHAQSEMEGMLGELPA